MTRASLSLPPPPQLPDSRSVERGATTLRQRRCALLLLALTRLRK
jgi:hypothetical protein